MGNPHGRDAAWRDLCADLDSVSDLNPPRGRRRKRARRDTDSANGRDRRLCGQVRRAVQMGLADCGDPALQVLVVLDVEPTARPSCLCVHVLVPPETGPTEGADPLSLLARLNGATPRLRAEVARSIHRKKTPQLVYHLHTEERHDENG